MPASDIEIVDVAGDSLSLDVYIADLVSLMAALHIGVGDLPGAAIESDGDIAGLVSLMGGLKIQMDITMVTSA